MGPLHGKGGKGIGICALFSGPPGTGKTLAAHVVADSLGMDLYQVDLSSIVDKYIGETEKNLERVFVEAEATNAVLFFDEADALFGSRSEVKDAKDRYANQEIAYLLQRMEQFDGITVLASNLRGNIDPAFARRLHFMVAFPDPDEATRQRLWTHHLEDLADRPRRPGRRRAPGRGGRARRRRHPQHGAHRRLRRGRRGRAARHAPRHRRRAPRAPQARPPATRRRCPTGLDHLTNLARPGRSRDSGRRAGGQSHREHRSDPRDSGRGAGRSAARARRAGVRPPVRPVPLMVGHAEDRAERDADAMADTALGRLRRLEGDTHSHGPGCDHSTFQGRGTPQRGPAERCARRRLRGRRPRLRHQLGHRVPPRRRTSTRRRRTPTHGDRVLPRLLLGAHPRRRPGGQAQHRRVGDARSRPARTSSSGASSTPRAPPAATGCSPTSSPTPCSPTSAAKRLPASGTLDRTTRAAVARGVATTPGHRRAGTGGTSARHGKADEARTAKEKKDNTAYKGVSGNAGQCPDRGRPSRPRAGRRGRRRHAAAPRWPASAAAPVRRCRGSSPATPAPASWAGSTWPRRPRSSRTPGSATSPPARRRRRAPACGMAAVGIAGAGVEHGDDEGERRPSACGTPPRWAARPRWARPPGRSASPPGPPRCCRAPGAAARPS